MTIEIKLEKAKKENLGRVLKVKQKMKEYEDLKKEIERDEKCLR